jgi:hypothetical protein
MNKKVQKLLEELGSAAAKPSGVEHREGKTLKVSFGNSAVYSADVHMQAEEVESVIVESYLDAAKGILEAFDYDTQKYTFSHLAEAVGFIPSATLLNEEESVEVQPDAEAEVSVEGDKLVIEIPLAPESVGELDEFGAPVAQQVMQESFRNIYRVLSSKLNEEESVEVPADAEAEVKVEEDKLVIEIPLESEVDAEEVSEEQVEAIQEQIRVIRKLLKEGLTFEDLYPEDQFRRDSLVKEFVLMEETKAVELLGRLNENSLMLFESMFDTYIGGETFLNEKGFFDFVRNKAGQVFKDPLVKAGNFVKGGIDQASNAIQGAKQRTANNLQALGAQAGNALKAVTVDPLQKLGNNISNLGSQAVVNMRTLPGVVGNSVAAGFDGIKRRIGANQAGKAVLNDYGRKLLNPVTGAIEIYKKGKVAEKNKQSAISDDLLTKRRNLEQQYKDSKNSSTMTVAQYNQLKADRKAARKATGGLFGDVTRNVGKFFTGKDVVPKFALDDQSKNKIALAGKRTKNLYGGLQQSVRTARDDAQNQYMNNLPPSAPGAALADATKKRDSALAANELQRQAQNNAIDANRGKIGQDIESKRIQDNTASRMAQQGMSADITGSRVAANQKIDVERQAKLDKIDSDVNLKESYTREDLLELFEALELDTRKYTFEYLAEELGFEAAKPVATKHSEGKALKVSFGNSKVYSPEVHQQEEEVLAPIIESLRRR